MGKINTQKGEFKGHGPAGYSYTSVPSGFSHHTRICWSGGVEEARPRCVEPGIASRQQEEAEPISIRKTKLESLKLLHLMI